MHLCSQGPTAAEELDAAPCQTQSLHHQCKHNGMHRTVSIPPTLTQSAWIQKQKMQQTCRVVQLSHMSQPVGFSLSRPARAARTPFFPYCSQMYEVADMPSWCVVLPAWCRCWLVGLCCLVWLHENSQHTATEAPAAGAFGPCCQAHDHPPNPFNKSLQPLQRNGLHTCIHMYQQPSKQHRSYTWSLAWPNTGNSNASIVKCNGLPHRSSFDTVGLDAAT